MKTCSKCRESKELSSFHKDSTKKDGLYSSCKSCTYSYSSSQTRLERGRAHDKVRRSEVIKRNKARALGHKLKLIEMHGGRCLDCNQVWPPFVFEFDHRDPSLKEFNVSGANLNFRFDRLVVEANKCDLVCSNCHRLRTHRMYCEGCENCAS
jgi:hypothetical protein